MRRRLALLPLALAIACDGDPPPPTTVIPDPNGTVAVTVGPERVTARSLAAIATKENISAEEAVDRAAIDAIFAAKARKELTPRHVRQLANTVLARAVWTDEWNRLKKQPTTPKELKEATQAFWLHYARPEGRRTAHAVVEVKDDAPAEQHAAAKAMAQRILDGVRDAVEKNKDLPPPERTGIRAFGPDAFKSDELLRQFSHAAGIASAGSPFKVTIQELPSVAKNSIQIAAGVQPGAAFHPAYTKGAWSLSERGQLSGLVKSSFGYHVIVLLEITPANILSPEEREAALRDEILRVRAVRRRRALLEELEAAAQPELSANHAAQLLLIDVAKASGDEAEAAP